MKMISTLAVLAAVSLFAGGCQSKGECTDGKAACCEGTKAAAAGSAANSMCVMNPGEKVAEGVTADYKGTKVGFCCAGKFNALSDADKSAKLAKVGVTVK